MQPEQNPQIQELNGAKVSIVRNCWNQAIEEIQSQLSQLNPAEIENPEDSIFQYTERAGLIIHQCLSNIDLLGTIPDLQDYLWLFTKDGFAPMLRRPMLNSRNIQLLRTISPETEDEQAILNTIIREAQGEAYYDYSGSLHESDLTQEMINIISKNPSFAHQIAEMLTQRNSEFDDLQATLFERYYDTASGISWSTDPGHGSTFLSLPARIGEFLDLCKAFDANNLPILPSLLTPQKFLLVEDSRSSIWPDILCERTGLVPYADKSEQDGISFDGCRHWHAESALSNLASLEEGRWPEVILTDLELGKGNNGVAFIEKVAVLANKPKTILVFAYSSNIQMYQEQLDALVATGLLAGYFSKQSFSVGSLINSIKAISGEIPPGPSAYGLSPSENDTSTA